MVSNIIFPYLIFTCSLFLNILTGSTLLKVGLCQQKLGTLEKDFASSAAQVYSDPLKKFMESDLKV